MTFRLLNWQGMAGIAVAFTLAVMLTVQKLEAVHWKKRSESIEQLYQQEQAAFATTVASYRAAAETARAADQANAARVAAEQGAINERTRMISKPALPLLALALCACASNPKAQPIPVLSETHQCPAFPSPPPALLKPPAKTDFLKPTR